MRVTAVCEGILYLIYMKHISTATYMVINDIERQRYIIVTTTDNNNNRS